MPRAFGISSTASVTPLGADGVNGTFLGEKGVRGVGGGFWFETKVNCRVVLGGSGPRTWRAVVNNHGDRFRPPKDRVVYDPFQMAVNHGL